MADRPTWDEYFMEIATVASKRSTCLRRSVGAVIVKDNHIISTGYNGSPKNTHHCKDVGCIRQLNNISSGTRHEFCRGSHAEINAIAQAASIGVATNGATLYCTHQPCAFCAKAIINAGIRKIIYANPYPDEIGFSLLKEAGLELKELQSSKS